jgi:hypothetical protein
MSKILFSVLILTIMSSSLCYSMNDLEYQNSSSFYQQNNNDFLEFVKGVNSGFGFFTGLPYENECKGYDSKALDLAQEIFNDMKKINIRNGVDILKRNIPKALKIIDIISNKGGACKNWANELKQMAQRLINRVNQNNYARDAVLNALTNMAAITDMTVTSVKHYVEKDFFNSGRMAGELMRFIFFWVL